MLERAILEKKFDLETVNPQGVCYDNVSRFILSSADNTRLEIDICVEEFTDSFKDISVKFYALESTSDIDYEQLLEEPNLKFVDYATIGTIYTIRKFQNSENMVEIYASFGGLLMRLTGGRRDLKSFVNDKEIIMTLNTE